jgi:hypothetical protein
MLSKPKIRDSIAKIEQTKAPASMTALPINQVKLLNSVIGINCLRQRKNVIATIKNIMIGSS